MQEIVFENTVLLIGLLLVHLIADFYLQPFSWVESRNAKHAVSPYLYIHSLLHGLLAAVVTLLLGDKISLDNTFYISVSIALTHFIIDLIKSYSKPSTTSFLIDQLAHVLVIFIAFLSVTKQWGESVALLKALNSSQLAVLLAYLAVLKPSSIIIKQLLSPWTDEVMSKPAKRHNIKDTLSLNLEAQQTLALAGQRIGYLERMLMLTFVLLNQFSAIGFLIAAKSIFRFGDLTKHQDRKLTEYVLLGTFTSVAITLVIGLACAYMLDVMPVK